jgi:carbonic anhydrase/acetyltransferase-like protein (isoleucine patch superfamily)
MVGCLTQPGTASQVRRRPGDMTVLTSEALVPVYAIGDRVPRIDPTAFVHPDAVVIGDVVIGPESTVWPTAVLRGDHGSVVVGARTSIQDGTIVHCTSELSTVIGDDCVVGHNAHLEGCTIEERCLIGSGSVVLHRVVVRRGAVVGASALVPNDTEVPARAMALGVPCKIREDAVAEGAFQYAVDKYVHNGHWYRAELRRLDI